jgi:hypothetical protein
MRALMLNGTVMSVSELDFDVHPDYIWVDCPNDVLAGFTYEDGVFNKPYSEMIPEYILQREYPPIEDQLDIQYWDSINGTTVWLDTIKAIKEEYPKE